MKFREFLKARLAAGGFSTEDALASFLPLLREVIEAHSAGSVAPLDGVDNLQVDGVKIWFEESRRLAPRDASARVREIEAAAQAAFEIMSETRRVSDLDEGVQSIVRSDVATLDAPIERPAFLPGYRSWECELGHHDPSVDAFCLGQILASLACGLDLDDAADVALLATHRQNPFAIHAGLHPVLARTIVRMTELSRRRRASDLASILRCLENYREQQVDLEFDLASVPGFQTRDERTRRQVVLSRLRERLFDLSRRNNLLHFRATLSSLNLTQASTPLSFDVKNIRPDQIFTWNDEVARRFAAGDELSLSGRLNFAEALYLPAVLDRIIADARRDQAEYGFAQLRLAICFLAWANLKETPPQPCFSPLALLPVRLYKAKGVRDTYRLEPLSTEAEINPVLRHQFKRLYEIDLPDSIDLQAGGLDGLFEYLSAKIQASEPSVALTKIERPRIDLIHEKARRRLDQYRRSARIAGRGVRSFRDIEYSYDPVNFHPLGLKIFSALVRPPETQLRATLETAPRSRQYAVSPADSTDTPASATPPPIAEVEQSFYAVRDAVDENPYQWNFDLCSVTLANFHYRKMSLVRDYDAALRDEPQSPAFEAAFSLAPRPAGRPAAAPPLAERRDVIACDPTQAAAIATARRGESYIIQGPPGAGKSQTIANLIADFVARGKRVLFVCEKRAAIDVVYERLRQCGLAPLCCLIHDSQTDKKSFVLDLKQAYETHLAELDASEAESAAERDRKTALEKLLAEVNPLDRFDRAMHESPMAGGLSLRRLLARCVELRDRWTGAAAEWLPELSEMERERLPDYVEWDARRDAFASFDAELRETQSDGVFARHPLRLLSPVAASLERPVAEISARLQDSLQQVEKLAAALSKSSLPPESYETFARARELVEYANEVAFLAASGHLSLADSASSLSRSLAGKERHCAKKAQGVAEAVAANRAWRHKLEPTDVAAALERARDFERRSLPWLSPGWWSLRGLLRQRYDFAAHAVAPKWSAVLERLHAEYEETASLYRLRADLAEQFSITGDQEEYFTKLAAVRDRIKRLPPAVADVHARLKDSPDAKTTIAQLAAAWETVRRVDRAMQLPGDAPLAANSLIQGFDALPLATLRSELQTAFDHLDRLPGFLGVLSDMQDWPPALRAAFCELPLSLDRIEATIAREAIERLYRNDRWLARFTQSVRSRQATRVQKLYDVWREANTAQVRDSVARRFRDRARLSTLPAARLTPEQKEFKRAYSQGRRELEHEFGKSMRYKAIRELVAAETGEIIKDLKPVWLMSPLSVSDTLPLEAGFVDVAIFDEASQIPLEESAPTLFRGAQAIVVGDEMQLPPTDFFSARREPDADEPADDGTEFAAFELESNSLLNHAAKNLSATMLGWHYRSRSESLISFSNRAFYEGRLLTVPEETLPGAALPPLDVAASDDAARHARDLLTRPLSFHFLQNGLYENRRNRAEAEYIARLVRELLAAGTGASLGVIAFSEAQQSEIEAALARLAQEDDDFAERYDAELEREENGQFAGLLVKNLENIQGDERDIVILSVCYGRGPTGKMLMNFGPINRSGGEKRLNVAFSRAKRFMAVVSSIRHADVKNEYNDGANCLKNYLKYAEACSAGDVEGARRVLAGLSRTLDHSWTPPADDPVAASVARALVGRGYEVQLHVGDSRFRVDVAVRKGAEPRYALGILIDAVAPLPDVDSLEREVMRPRLLETFGWRVTQVLAKDWWADPSAELDRLTKLLEGQAESA